MCGKKKRLNITTEKMADAYQKAKWLYMDGQWVNPQWQKKKAGHETKGSKRPFWMFFLHSDIEMSFWLFSPSTQLNTPLQWLCSWRALSLQRYAGRGKNLMKRMPTEGHPWSPSPAQLIGLHFGNCKLLPCLHKPHVYSSRRQSRARDEAGVWMIKWNVVWVSMLNGIEGSLCRTDREEARGKFSFEINFKPSILSDYVYFQSEFCNHSTQLQSEFSISRSLVRSTDNLLPVTAPP